MKRTSAVISHSDKSRQSALGPFAAINRLTPAHEQKAAIRELIAADERQQC